jgi:hypothetical protein
MTPRMPAKRKMRVIALLNAISNLHKGDLHAVLELDSFIPLWEFEDEEFEQVPAVLKSLRDRLRRGEDLARIYEDHLMQIMCLGETMVTSYPKLKRAKGEFGGREW